MAERARVYPLRREPQPEPPAREHRAQEPLWREVLGQRLRALRQEQRETLAETAGRAGVSPQYLSEVERGRKEPSSETDICAVTLVITAPPETAAPVAAGTHQSEPVGGPRHATAKMSPYRPGSTVRGPGGLARARRCASAAGRPADPDVPEACLRFTGHVPQAGAPVRPGRWTRAPRLPGSNLGCPLSWARPDTERQPFGAFALDGCRRCHALPSASLMGVRVDAVVGPAAGVSCGW